MKLSNLFMIALLAGTLGVFGCSSDPETGNGGSGGEGTAGTGGSGTAGTGGSGTAGTGGSGTAGTGGSGTAGNCDYGDCMDPGTQRDLCETQLGICETLYPDMEGVLWDSCVAAANLDACGVR